MRSRISWEVAEEAKENWFPAILVGGSSSDSPAISSGIELLVQEEEPLAGFETVQGNGGGGATALDTSRAEALHDLERNSIGNLGLSGSWVPPRGEAPARGVIFGRSVSSMKAGAFGVLQRGDEDLGRGGRYIGKGGYGFYWTFYYRRV